MKRSAPIHFSSDYAKSVSEEQFVKDHEHYKDEVDLKAKYAELRGLPDSEAKPSSKTKSKK